MKPGSLLVSAFILAIMSTQIRADDSAQNAPEPGRRVSAEILDDRIIVRVNGQTFTVYRFGTGQKYPYFYPVNGPVSGEPLTTESSVPYPHHRSLFFGCDRVNGGNYWQEGNERGQIVSTGARITLNGPAAVEITDDCNWRQPGQKPIITDHRQIHIEAPSPDLRIIDFAVDVKALTPIRIERTNHSLFSVRMRHELSVLGGGVLINAEGSASEKGTYGSPSPWADFSGKICGMYEGVAIFDGPKNPWFPSKWFTRDYGFFSPTPLYWLDDDGFRIKEGETLRLQYRVVVHAGDAGSARIADLFKNWLEKASPK